MEENNLTEITDVYSKLIKAWNNRDARGMAELYAKDGINIGFDGSQAIGDQEILSHLEPIFNDHPTPPFTCKVKDVQYLSPDVAMLRAIAGMIPPQQSDINPELNAFQTLVVTKTSGDWQVKLFQNTPAQFHGKPELVSEMTEELRELL